MPIAHAGEVWTTAHRHADDRQAGRRERLRFWLGLGGATKLNGCDDHSDESEKSFHDILLR